MGAALRAVEVSCVFSVQVIALLRLLDAGTNASTFDRAVREEMKTAAVKRTMIKVMP